jgi:hypothetical protein
MDIRSILKQLQSHEEVEGTVVTLTLDLAGSGLLPPETRVFLKKVVESNLESEARLPKVQTVLRKIYRRLMTYVGRELDPGSKGLYLVAGRGIWLPVELKVRLKNFVRVGSCAYLPPLVAAEAAHPGAYVVEANGEEAVITWLHLGESEAVRKLGEDLVRQPLERVRTSRSKDHLSTGPGRGGATRDREHQRKEAVGRILLHHAADAVKALHTAHPAEAIYLAGPQDAFAEFASRLTPDLRKRTLAIGARNGEVLPHAFRELEALVGDRLERDTKAFHERRAEGLQVALGPRDLLDQLYSGQIERLYLNAYDPVPGVLCTGCGVREPGLRAKCAYCAEAVVETSLTQDVVKHALAHPPIGLTFLGNEAGWLSILGGMAGVLSTKGAPRRTTPALH